MIDDGTKLWERADFLRNKMSIRELAERSNVNERTLQTTRSANTVPTLKMLYPIAKVLNTTVDYLYSGIEPEDEFDGEMFRKLASNQDYVDIVQKLFTADEMTLNMVKRILGLI